MLRGLVSDFESTEFFGDIFECSGIIPERLADGGSQVGVVVDAQKPADEGDQGIWRNITRNLSLCEIN